MNSISKFPERINEGALLFDLQGLHVECRFQGGFLVPGAFWGWRFTILVFPEASGGKGR